MKVEKRSNCPISFTLDLVGDKWSLLVLRDIVLFGKKFYNEFNESGEGISTNILADRLSKLESHELITKERDEQDKKRFIYRPTRVALDLTPLLVEMVLFGAKHDPTTAATADRIRSIKKDKEAFIKGIQSQFK